MAARRIGAIVSPLDTLCWEQAAPAKRKLESETKTKDSNKTTVSLCFRLGVNRISLGQLVLKPEDFGVGKIPYLDMSRIFRLRTGRFYNVK